MKPATIFFLILGVWVSRSIAQNVRLEKIWQTEPAFRVPESVVYNPENRMLYVSNIFGEPNKKDGKGCLSKMTIDNKGLVAAWITGLNAPKGMGLYKQHLYVADIDEVVVIDLKIEKIVERIPIPGAVFLNDISINDKGVLFVSDTKTGIIHKIENGTAGVFIDGQKGVNGLLARESDLYFLVKGILWKAGKDGKLLKISEGLEESTDGIEPAGKDFIVSCWSGMIYYINSDGSNYILLDTREQFLNSADIGFNPKDNVLYVPTFYSNRIVAYQVK
jgi:DNA-binding beta-propeller fold protein YncE